jgi:hypothetical protein
VIMPVDLHRLRDLRSRTEARGSSFVEDFLPFLLRNNTFCRTPEKIADPPSVTTVCTCLMAVAVNGRTKSLYKTAGRTDPIAAVRNAFRTIVSAEWDTAGLAEGNNFTRVLALRTAGLLLSEDILSTRDLRDLRHAGQTIPDIAREMLTDIPAGFGVQKFGPKSALAYWFLDAIDHLKIALTTAQSTKLVEWATAEFGRQFSYVAANHDALLDPVAMIMAACVVKRLHKWRARGRLPRDVYDRLPPIAELRHSVGELFRFQGKSGIWPKYFPLFNYPKTGASNYCFTFEFLEAALAEFGDQESRLFETSAILQGLELALEWCNENRFVFFQGGTTFYGWNSGTESNLLREGVPESWASGTVHMFLAKLREALSDAIDRSVVASWVKAGELPDWDKLIDAPMQISGGERTTLKRIIEEEILDKVSPHPTCDRKSYRRSPIRDRRSAVLFGPPGTSKTTLVKALAAKLNWPYIEVTPSDFVGNGMDQIYARTVEIFRDLMDLAGVVVLFDEMDALATKREAQPGAEQLDVVRQLLTTSMLPKLADLHAQKQIIFFMNTNHRNGIDSAITRAGRFDMLLHVVPPTWSEKLKHLDRFYSADPSEVTQAEERLRKWTAKSAKEREILNRFTFAETRSFLEHIRRTRGHEKLSQAFRSWDQHGFLELVLDWGRKFIVLKENSSELKEYLEDQGSSSLQ